VPIKLSTSPLATQRVLPEQKTATLLFYVRDKALWTRVRALALSRGHKLNITVETLIQLGLEVVERDEKE
jgi:hypothetical protein